MLTGKDNAPLVVMKPIVENMGLDWKGQHVKLTEISALLSYAAPVLTVLGSTEPDEPTIITEFWDAIEELTTLGIHTNHAHDNATIAININEVVRLAQ